MQKRVVAAAREWAKYANIRFGFGEDPNAEIPISLQQPGSWSYVGTDALLVSESQSTMNFGWLTAATDDVELNRVVLDEFEHTLGLSNAHQSPVAEIPWDRDAVIEYLSLWVSVIAHERP